MPVPTSVASMSSSEKPDQGSSSEQEEAPQQTAEQKESVILVQVNPGETFTIQAENQTQCIKGPAQVPMVSPNGVIPPIQVPHGYISQVIEDHHGYRKVVVIPEQPARFPGGPGPQSFSQSAHGMPHSIPMQPGTHYNYMQQLSSVPMNQVSSAGDHMHLFHQPMYEQLEGLAPADIEQRNIQFVSHPFQHPQQTLDPDSRRSAGNAKEMSQRRSQDRRQQYLPDPNKNPSPSFTHSISPSSSSSYITSLSSLSPNSSPDSSPRITSSSDAGDGDSTPQAKVHHMPHLSSGQPEHRLPSAFSPNVHGKIRYGGATNSRQNTSTMSSGDGISSGSSSGGSPRHVSSSSNQQIGLPKDEAQPNPDFPGQNAGRLSNDIPLRYPINDRKWDLKEFLSAITKPEVFDISPRCASVKWSMRYLPPADSPVEMQTIIFEVYLMHKGKDGNKFKLVNREGNNCYEIKDLKPGVEYHTKVLAEFNSVKGGYSEVATFRTSSCPPDTPGAPKMTNNTKNSIILRWAAPNDNGEKILKYHLEWDEGEKGSGFRSLSSDNQKQQKVTKLQPLRYYTFRLSCENKVGVSPWSPEVTHKTCGTAPAIPDPPQLHKAYVQSLVINWSGCPAASNDPNSGYHTRFVLEMDDGMGYGFRVVYDGADLRAMIKNLNRSSFYKFRLRAYNNEGKSGYSAIASFPTLPDRPGPPGKIVLKSKAHPTWFKVTWDPPSDDGGSAVTNYILKCAKEKSQPLEQIYSGADNEYLVGNVQPGDTCRLRVLCVTDGGTSPPSEVSLVSAPPVVPGQCAPPRAASKLGPTVISLKWDPPNYNGGSSVTQYEVAMCLDPSDEITRPEQSLKQVYLGSELDHTVGNFKPGTTYRFVVRAANRVGMGQWSGVAELSTSAGPPGKPDLPEPEVVTSDSVLLVWKKPHDDGSAITGYLVEWGSEDSAMNVQRTSSATTCNFTHLTPNLTYFFRVQARNDVGKGPYSDVATVKTVPSCPGRIAKVWQGDILPIDQYEEDEEADEDTFPRPDTCAMVCWDRPLDNGCAITHFILEVVLAKSGKKKLTTTEKESFFDIDGKDCSYLLQNLQPDSMYRVRIKGVNEIGSGSFSSQFPIETQPLPPDPPLLQCTCSHNSLKLKWSDTDSNATCVLQMREKHGRYVTIYNGLSRTYKLSRCTERTTYYFRINAKNDAGEGPFSDVYSFTTTTAPPPQLKSLPSVTVRGQCADVSWEEVESIKGDAISYVLNIEPYGHSVMKQTISQDQSSYKLNDLVPGSRYKVQVALVRHVASGVTPSEANEDSDNLSSANVDRQEEKMEDACFEDVVGPFTNWVTFEVPQPDSVNGCDEKHPTGAVDPDRTSQTLAQVVNNLRVRMSDDTMGPVLLMVTFFFLAIGVACSVQFLMG